MLKFAHFDRRSGEFVETNPCLCGFGLSEVVLPALMAVGSSVAAGAGAAAGAVGTGLGAIGSGIGAGAASLGLPALGDAIGAGWTAGGLTGALSGGLGSLGVPAGVASFAAPVLERAGIGAGLGALTGNAGTGAALGAATGALGQLSGGAGAAGTAAGAASPWLTGSPQLGVGPSGAPGVTPVDTSSIANTMPQMPGGALTQAAGNPLAQNASAVAGKAGGNSDLSSIIGMLQALGTNAFRPSTTAPSSATANMPWAPSGYLNRTPTNAAPASGSYYTYGSVPEPQFFSGNQLNFTPGMAHGGALSRAMAGGQYASGGALNHGQEFSTGGGENYVEGAGDGQSDEVPARLSDGEFVMDATTTSKLGAGSSDAGAKGMQAIRHAINEDTKSNGIVMRKPKSPLHYADVGMRAARAA